MKHYMQSPAALAGANRVTDINACTAVDFPNPIETRSQIQAANIVARRYRVSIHHARVICGLSGLGGRYDT